MLRGAIIGFGEVARHGHWPAWANCPDARIVAVVDRSESRRQLATELDDRVAAFATFADLTSAMGTAAVDFVDICTPPSLHPEPMMAAIDRGWHVLCEKPFVLDASIIDFVIRAAARHEVAVVPVSNWKYAPIIQAATEALVTGAIGKLQRVSIETSRIRAAATADAGANWRRNPELAGGGILMDHGWHALYLALHWFNERAGSVTAALHLPTAGGVEDEAALTVGFASGTADIRLTWNGRARRNACRLEGSDGDIVVDDDRLTVRSSSRQETTVFPAALSAGSHHADWFAAMLPDVVACFRQPSRAHPLVAEAAECLGIIDQAYRSSRSLA
ncbi:MAG TPA: Gfo/Idh/MocA family oxidoreductase [Vicinamibacterales bacterium]|jgi:predicted dehydrogenase|nr:Gfo/Idh/MocA family oxidoreductase [Vicinamibacterales bacterium]